MRKCYIFPPIKPDFYPLESEFSISGNHVGMTYFMGVIYLVAANRTKTDKFQGNGLIAPWTNVDKADPYVESLCKKAT